MGRRKKVKAHLGKVKPPGGASSEESAEKLISAEDRWVFHSETTGRKIGRKIGCRLSCQKGGRCEGRCQA
jgi:hypothetical protein